MSRLGGHVPGPAEGSPEAGSARPPGGGPQTGLMPTTVFVLNRAFRITLTLNVKVRFI